MSHAQYSQTMAFFFKYDYLSRLRLYRLCDSTPLKEVDLILFSPICGSFTDDVLSLSFCVISFNVPDFDPTLLWDDLVAVWISLNSILNLNLDLPIHRAAVKVLKISCGVD